MKTIVNLTQHTASPDQVSAGVFDSKNSDAVAILLTFDKIPTAYDIFQKARELARIATNSGAKSAMIGGAPWFMKELEFQLKQAGIAPFYAFSTRVSEEQVQADGSVKKINVFKHIGFVPAGGIQPLRTEDDMSREGE